MSIMAQNSGGAMSPLHPVTGFLAIALMLFHAAWATYVVFRGNEKTRRGFHTLRIGVWLLWLVPYLVALLIGIPAFHVSDPVAVAAAAGVVAVLALALLLSSRGKIFSREEILRQVWSDEVIVLDRTIERRRRVISDAYELGTTLPDPTVEPERGEGADERAEAERRLLEVLGEHDGEADASDLDDDWVGGRAPLSEAGLWLGGEPGRGVRIFISHVEELVVHN